MKPIVSDKNLKISKNISNGQAISVAPIVIDKITVLGSRCGQFAPALRLLDRVNFSPLISAIYSVDDAIEAFEKIRVRTHLKFC